MRREQVRHKLKSGVGTIVALAIVLFNLCVKPQQSRADRIVLAPAGTTLTENSYLSEFAVGSSTRVGDYADYSWLAYSSGDGIEMEVNRLEENTERNKQWSMNIEYPLPTLRNLPAISVGVRDLTGTGTEHGALYIAGTRSLRLSGKHHPLFKAINVSAGAGTGTIGGAFVGVETRLTIGLSLSAELYRHRPNVSIGLPLIRNMQLKVYSLNGGVFYGMGYHWSL